MTSPLDHIDEALSLYALSAPVAELVRHNENITYKITDSSTGKTYLLRIHCPVDGFTLGILRPGADPAAFIRSELEIIKRLISETDMVLQTPVPGKNGDMVPTLSDGTPVTLLEWVDGVTVEKAEATPDILRNIGKTAALIHNVFAGRDRTLYSRYRYDQSILPAIIGRLEAAAACEAVTTLQSQTVIKAVYEIGRRFDRLDQTQEQCIVHADLSKSNMLLNTAGSITPIDFSLCGYSHYYMDVGALLTHFEDKHDRKHLLEGYISSCHRTVEPHFIEPYFALQVILFIACQYERAQDWPWFAGALDRWCADIFTPFAENKAFLLV
jgi:Ser/Thr protein kinase RdoA (MazF antagonist)